MFIHGFLLCNVLGIKCWVLNTLNLDNVFVCCTLGHRLVKYLQDIIVLGAACLEVNHMHLRFSISCLVHWHWIPCIWFFSCKSTISDDMCSNLVFDLNYNRWPFISNDTKYREGRIKELMQDLKEKVPLMTSHKYNN